MLTDSHCHLDFPCFDRMRNNLLDHCVEQNITHFINPTVAFSNWQRVIDLSLQYPSITPALGLHPCYVEKHQNEHLETLKPWLLAHHIPLVGEIGLDKRFIDSFDRQIFFFNEQLAIAQDLQKPVIIHSVKAHSEVIATLKHHDFKHGGIIHAFSGSFNIAKAYCDLGFKLGVGSILHYPNSKLPNVLKRIGIENILLETDSPDMPIPNSVNEINTPLSLLQTRDLLIDIFKLSKDDTHQALAQNSRIFGIQRH
ncbi:TatD family hydrolase [Cysteiniphilum sp. 6C5]|uniref:TatD family hydrolase n=1 Tax=unclassified Cysteiniphilum TaxID=2610889 RepID=UPI003F866B03